MSAISLPVLDASRYLLDICNFQFPSPILLFRSCVSFSFFLHTKFGVVAFLSSLLSPFKLDIGTEKLGRKEK